MRMLSMLALAGTLSLGLAGCDSAQEQAVLNGISNNCTSAVAGTAVLVTISSSLAGAAPVATISNTVGSNAGPICSAILAGAQSVIGGINAAGGTATVQVSTAAPLSAKYGVKLKARITPDGTMTYIVPPSPFSGL